MSRERDVGSSWPDVSPPSFVTGFRSTHEPWWVSVFSRTRLDDLDNKFGTRSTLFVNVGRVGVNQTRILHVYIIEVNYLLLWL